MRKHLKFQSVTVCLVLFVGLLVSVSLQAEDLKLPIANALEKGDTTLALDLLDQEIDLDKSYHYNYYIKGMIYYERMNYPKAIEQFELALDKKGKHYDSRYQLGLAYLELEDYDNAEKAFTEGKKKDKKTGHRFEDGLGLVYLARKQYQEADKAFRQALVDEDNALYHIHLGDANFYQGIPALAIMEYEKALELDTAGTEVYYHWAEACLEMKDYNCAIEKLKIVLQKDSTYAKAWMRAAGIYYKAARSSRTRGERNSRFKETIGAYKKYLELSNATADSSTVRVYFEIAMAYSMINGFEDAVENFEKVLAIPMEPRDIYFYYGKGLWGTKAYEKSGEILLKHMDWASKQDPEEYKQTFKDEELFQLLGDSYYYRDNKDYLKAIDYYKKSLELKPNQKRLVYNVAVGYQILKSYVQAIEYYQKRIDFGIDDKYASVYKNAGYCALNIANNSGDDEEEDLDEELDEEEVVAASSTVDPNVNYYEVAVNYFEQYLAVTPDDAKLISAVASTYLYQLADCAKGVEFFEKLAVLEPNNCEANKSLGYAYFSGSCTKNYTKALGYLKKAYSCFQNNGGDCESPDLLMYIAQCYHLRAAGKLERKEDANDDFKNAFNWYGKVLNCDPGNAEAKKSQNDIRFEFVE